MARDLTKDFKEFIELLNSHGVEYVIVGAWAIAFHGEPRLTGDLDVLIRAEEKNAQRMMGVLKIFGFGKLDISKGDLLKPTRVIQLGYKPNRIDILTSISGVAFDEAWKTRKSKTYGGLRYIFLGREALIKNKLASGREKDLQDVGLLKKLSKKRKKR